MPKHITLIGMMGAGKSTVAPILAADLGRPVHEVDRMIEEKEGMPISEIFIAKGEAYFRKAESEMIAHLISQPPAVLSLGGGAFQWDATRELLIAETIVFYLSATVEILASRVMAAKASRPLLNTPGVDLNQTIREMLERRGSYYGLAHYRIETDSHSPAAIAKTILTQRKAYE
jgi:shikimate kinase